MARALVGGAALVLALTSCATAQQGGLTMGRPASADPDTIGEFVPERVEQALLSNADVGGVFERAADEDTDYDTGVDEYDERFGCLTALDVLDNKANDPADGAHEFESALMAAIFTAVISYRDAGVAEDAMDDLADELERCKPVEIEEDGTTWTMTPRTDEDIRAQGGDRQTNVGGTGKLVGDGGEFSISVSGSAVRYRNHVVIVMFLDADDDLGDWPDELVQAAVDKLVAVAAGDQPPDPPGVMDDYQIADPGPGAYA